MNSRFRPLCLAVLLVLAGCAGSPSPDATTTGPPATETTATPVITTTTVDSPPTTTTISRAKILDYQNLQPHAQQTLRNAIENDSTTVTRSNLSGKLSPEKDGWYVRYRGERYRISLERRGLRGEYRLENATRVNASAVEDRTAVVTYRNLSARAQQLFDTVRTGGDTDTLRANFPSQLRTNRYVTYQGEYYELRTIVGDYITYRLVLVKVNR